jgi:hypothetical protein
MQKKKKPKNDDDTDNDKMECEDASDDERGESDEDDEGEEEEGGKAAAGILRERMWYDGKADSPYQRQYVVKRRDNRLTRSRTWTCADDHDSDDMPPKILAEWRACHPLKDMSWTCKGKNKGKLRSMERARSKWKSLL